MVVIQADDLLGLPTVIVAPTSTSARPASFRPTIEVAGTSTRVLVEQLRAISPERLAPDVAGRVSLSELRAIEDALELVLGLV